jgi:hypothetical protein
MKAVARVFVNSELARRAITHGRVPPGDRAPRRDLCGSGGHLATSPELCFGKAPRSGKERGLAR